WHGHWSVLIDNIRGRDRALWCWCQCVCGVRRLIRKGGTTRLSSNSCGCEARKTHSQRQKARTGERQHGWLGGHGYRGPIAWANELLRQSTPCSRDGGYAAPTITSEEVVRLFEKFAGSCPTCSTSIDKRNGRKLCLD